MSVKATVVTDSSGVQYTEERDGDTNVLLQRFRSPDSQQIFKVRLEENMAQRYADWLRWHTTRVEAVARGVPALVITPLTNRENNAWGDYVTAIQEWRAAT